MELRLRYGLEDEGCERYRRDTDLRRRGCRVTCYAQQTMRFSSRIICAGSCVRVYGFRAGEHKQYQDDERGRQLTERRAVILDCSVHICFLRRDELVPTIFKRYLRCWYSVNGRKNDEPRIWQDRRVSKRKAPHRQDAGER